MIGAIKSLQAAQTETSEAKQIAKKQAQKVSSCLLVLFLKKIEQSKMQKRKGLIEKSEKMVKDPKKLLGASHIEMRKKLQNTRSSRVKRNTSDMPSGNESTMNE